jgi:hypothetical protein
MSSPSWEPQTITKIVGGFNIPKSVIETKVDTLTFLELLLRKGLATAEEIDEIREAVVLHLNVLYPELQLTYSTPTPLADQVSQVSDSAPAKAASAPISAAAPLFIDAPPPKFL